MFRGRVDCLACTSHQLSAAATYPSALTALRSVGPLDGLHEYACASLRRDALSGRRLRRLATKPGEKCGLGVHTIGVILMAGPLSVNCGLIPWVTVP